MNKKMQGYFDHYLWSIEKYGLRDLDDAYGRYSSAKRHAYDYIRNERPNIRKMAMTVVGVSCHFFSVGYVYQQDGTYFFVYHTKCNRFESPLEPEQVEAFKKVCP